MKAAEHWDWIRDSGCRISVRGDFANVVLLAR